MKEKNTKKAPPANLGNKGNKNCSFGEIEGIVQRQNPINRAIALISLISLINPISLFMGEYSRRLPPHYFSFSKPWL
jgi:hypothetical protein